MGQINSAIDRSRSERESRTNVDQPSSSTPSSVPLPALSSPQTSAGRRARRKSIRNSIVDFVHPKPSRDASQVSGSRRPWRWSVAGRTRRAGSQDVVSQDHVSSNEENGSARSRSQGEAPLNSEGNKASSSHDNETTSSSSTAAGGPSGVQESDKSSRQPASPKGKERSTELSDNVADDSAAQSEEDARITSPFSQSASSSNSTILPGSTGNESSLDSSSPSQVPPVPPIPRISSSNHNSIRQFPPSGTLVVVQGVVRTDSPLTLAHGDSPLAAGVGRRSNDQSSVSEAASVLPDQRASNEASESPESPELSNPSAPRPNDTGNNSGSRMLESQPTSESNGATRTGPSEAISGSSGADVLGALLSIVSVATAATAASLLTTMGSNGLGAAPGAHEPHNLPANPSEPSAPDGPNIPSIARALASANPTAAAVLAERDREREERERHRTRSIWEGLRERVTSGRNRNTAGIGSHSLFNELVRAFNLNPTQDDQFDSQSASSGRDEDQATSTLMQTPSGDSEDLAPGSFERFLVDLQSDLRLALVHPNGVSNISSTSSTDRGESEGSEALLGGPSESAFHESEDTVISSSSDAVRRSEASVPVALSSDDRANRSSGAPGDGLGDEASHNEPADGGTPVAEPVLTSDSDATQRSQMQGADGTSSSIHTSANDARRNRVNWWRMYRFPPIISIRTRQQNAGEDQPERSNHLSASTPASRESEPSTENIAAGQDAPTILEPAVLIPVIVVGLQSISSRAQSDESDASGPSPAGNDSAEATQLADVSQLGNPPSTGAAQRARETWSSRAARAFNRLGRREDPVVPATDARSSTGGARTFLVYVFGGHYPPDHQILSGPDAADSFEALWELADFLGQVKPSVATEEEIERSGLELFKAASLQEYASSGRVASNCLDRCLICLDEYDAGDELRLMSCKHTFHRACVDRWLKTGRNNCPACRSKGVQTTDNPV